MDKKDRKLKYTNGEITIEWHSKLYLHAGNCFYLLPEVYKPDVRNWIKIENATTAELINQ